MIGLKLGKNPRIDRNGKTGKLKMKGLRCYFENGALRGPEDSNLPLCDGRACKSV